MKNKVVLIVGGSGGIGSAIASDFSGVGAKVILAGRDKSKLEKVSAQIKNNGGQVHSIQVDVTDVASVANMGKEAEEKFGKIDVLVNAFGQGLIQPFREIEPKDAKEVIDVNVYGTFLVTQTIMKHLNTGHSANVIMFPGTMGTYVMKNASVYSASKFAIQGFTKALVEELKRENVKFSLFYLGGVDTPFWDDDRINMRVKKEMMLTSKDVARSVFSAVMAPGNAVVNEIVMQPQSHQLT